MVEVRKNGQLVEDRLILELVTELLSDDHKRAEIASLRDGDVRIQVGGCHPLSVDVSHRYPSEWRKKQVADRKLDG